MKTVSRSIRTSRRFITVILTLLAAQCLLLTAAAQARDYTRWVNPFIGTGGHGHTFPGATVPFGMVQLSPDTRIDNWDGSSGYHYSDDIIYGFSHKHLSGTGIPDGCDILFMPTKPGWVIPSAGHVTKDSYPSKFSHQNERAEPGYYSVLLDDENILAELTATTRVGLHRYTFAESKIGEIVLDLQWRDKLLESDVQFIDDRRIEGFRRSQSWAKDQKVYFAAEFSQSFRAPRGGANLGRAPGTVLNSENKKSHAFFAFDTSVERQVLLKVAISYVSIEGARKNLEAELPHWDFDKVRADAKAAWNKELSKIEVSGGTDEQTTNFYTALYHTMIHPNVFNDVDGQYKGHDGKVHQLGSADTPVRMSVASTRIKVNESKSSTGNRSLAGGTGDADKSVRAPSDHYTVFSLWDTFRATHPLYTIIDQRRTVDYINSFIRIYEQGGRLPVWELWGEETDTMIGYHSVSVIADAMAKGIKGFDYEKAYAAAKHSANLDHHGLAAYKRRGYISAEDDNESVSKTLEYAYNDWCIAQMAKILTERKKRNGRITRKSIRYAYDDRLFSFRAKHFENLYDPNTRFFRPKQNGGFIRPFAPNEVTFHFTEGNSWQYSFFVPHDVSRLIELEDGPEYFAGKLERLFTTNEKLTGRFQPDITGLIGQYAHGNEPSHHIPYLFTYAGQPWRAQKYVRKIMDEFYRNAPDGLIGNEDAGQMSAWYILSASGFYPVAPGSPVYAFGTPLFPEMKYNLENGKTFTIRADGVSAENIYVAGAMLNGRPQTKAFLNHADVMNGGELVFTMSPSPVVDAFTEFPVSSTAGWSAPVLTISADRVFRQSTRVFMNTIAKDVEIRYTTDGSQPTRRSKLYIAPFVIDKTTRIRAIAMPPKGQPSYEVEAVFTKRENDWSVLSTSGYSTQYTGGGDDAMVDGLRGTRNFASGEWQGYQGKVLEAVIDLKERRRVMEVGGSFLQTTRSWIWMPSRIEFEASDDGVTFRKIAEIKTDVPLTDETPQVKEFLTKLTAPVTGRYIRVRAFNIGPIPAWHPGAGGDPWIFVDEVIIR
ncbi:MAG: GH92 family glycosyl hydrolase [Acidobacteria bacterium]|nr:GH92 family glycosyl hydrolase [Acidobacteriota bacterium]